MSSLLVFSSLDTNFRSLCDCFYTHTLYFLVGSQDTSILHFFALSVGVTFKFVAAGEVTLQLAL
jgi:hypothetical protein